MFTLPQSVKIYLATQPVDMRNQIDGLMSIVRNIWKDDPYTGHLFVFVSRKRNRVKILFFDHRGFVVIYKRLERGRFKLPVPDSTSSRIQIEASELTMLFRGIDFDQVKKPASWAPKDSGPAPKTTSSSVPEPSSKPVPPVPPVVANVLPGHIGCPPEKLLDRRIRL